MYSKNLKTKFKIFYTAPDIPDDNRCDMIVICCSVLTWCTVQCKAFFCSHH